VTGVFYGIINASRNSKQLFGIAEQLLLTYMPQVSFREIELLQILQQLK